MPLVRFARNMLLACAVPAGLTAACAAEVAKAQAEVDGSAPVEVATEGLAIELSGSRCQALSQFQPQGVTITKAEMVAAGSVTPEGADAPLPQHCLVQGKIDPYNGIDNKPYAIGFEVRLPSAWNRRFFFQGGSFTDGVLQPAFGRFSVSTATNALTLGYAVASTDGGHISEADPAIGGAVFGVDPQARLNFGYNAVDRTTVVSKKLIEEAYGKEPSKSYFVGCSNGGRQAMVAASRFKHFDGIVAGDAGFNLPKAALQHPWDTQSLAAIGAPTFADSFSPSDLAAVGAAVTATCDTRDGLADGMVNDFAACVFNPATLQCSGAKAEGCLSAAQVLALQHMFAGVSNSAGMPLYTNWAWDNGVGAFGWRLWKMGPLAPEVPFGLIQAFGGSALAYIFVTPPVQVVDPIGYSLGFNFDTDSPKIFATTGTYTQSSMEFMTPPDVSMKKLKSKGGKMIVHHAASDPVFSVMDTIRWYGEFDSANDGKGRDFVRLFAVPGMTHCGGGASTDRFDMLTEIVNWVEKAKAPERILASVGADNPEVPAEWGARTRPLCVWPAQPSYKGSGDINDAANFKCK
jgi:hypothetical protein